MSKRRPPVRCPECGRFMMMDPAGWWVCAGRDGCEGRRPFPPPKPLPPGWAALAHARAAR